MVEELLELASMGTDISSQDASALRAFNRVSFLIGYILDKTNTLYVMVAF